MMISGEAVGAAQREEGADEIAATEEERRTRCWAEMEEAECRMWLT